MPHGHDPAPAVRARGLVKRFGDRVAVDGVDVDVPAGACVGFLGPNGAGKTTTMRMLCCLTPRDGGELAVLGRDPEREPRALKSRIGVVGQEVALDLELSVRQNLLVYARYFAIPRPVAERRAEELLELVALADRAGDAVEGLSGGMKRRLQIARALVNAPDLVLLDEPTTGLDPQARHVVWERLRALRGRGVTLVLTTHYMDEAEQLCDRLVIMDRGRVVREGAPADLIRAEVGREVLELRVSPDELAALRREAGDGVQAEGDLVQLYTDDAEALHARLRTRGVAGRLQAARRATLEDVFLRLTGRRLRED
ncbi:MAG TPA: ABC transporter ATP-binding protein [Miltoncostaeaceae bacterium]|nr:ABC transporter ATP-binding protein [Miltoncostaeaceae bacterium]